MTTNTIKKMAAIAALIFGFGFASWAEQVTIGNLESASQNASLPFNGTFSYSYTQQIYTAEEIGGAGAINSLTVWLVHTGTEALPTFNIDIYMKEVSKDAFSGTTDWVSVSSTDKVYTGTLTVANTTARAFTFTLDRSFVYSGQNNLLIAFDDNTGSWKSGLRGMVFGTAGTPARSIYALNDNTNFDPTSMSGVTAYTTSYQRNVIELGIYDEDLSNIHNITIGDLQSTSQIAQLPWYGVYDYSYSQQIYTADEIGTSGTINAVTMWLVHTGSEALPTFNIDIYMKEVDKETFSGSNDWVSVSATDKVYSGSVKVTNTSAQAFTFTLATPFAYSGQGNLLIVFDDNTGSYKSGLRGIAFGTASDPYRAVYACRDGSDYDPFNMGGVTSSTLTRRNVVALSMTDCPALPGLNTVTIGDTESTAYHTVLPMTSTYNYTYSQQIFTPEEIGEVGTINTLTMWLRNNSMNILPTLVFDIYMREVDKDAFTGLTDWVSVSATDKVYSGTLTVTNSTFQSYTFTLDTPFEYSGEGNLLIAFDENTGYWKSGLQGKVSGTNSDPIRAISARRDSSDYDPFNMSGVSAYGTTYQRNVVELGIDIPCAAPTDLAIDTLGFTFATLSWTENGEATAWQICLNDDENNLIMADSNPFTVNNLTYETSYTAKVRAYCDATNQSGWSNSISFIPTQTITLTVNEGTSNYTSIPANITYFNRFTRSQFVIPADNLGTMAGTTICGMRFYVQEYGIPYTTDCPVDVYLKEVDYTIFGQDNLHFEPKADANIVYNGSLQFVSTENGGELTITFSDPYPYNGGNLLVGMENTLKGAWKTIRYLGTTTVYGASVDGYSPINPDYISASRRNFVPMTTFFYDPDACFPAVSIESVDITDHEATLAWTGGSGTYNLETKKNLGEWTRILTETTDTIYILENLDEITDYHVRVQSVCGDKTSVWRTTTFATQCEPVALPYTQGFESPEGSLWYNQGPLPTCWEGYSTGNTVPHNNSGSFIYDGEQSLAFDYNADSSYAILPKFELPINELQISFYMQTYFTNTGDFGQLQLGYLTEEGELDSFIPIEDYDNSNSMVQRMTFLCNVPYEAPRLAFKWSTTGGVVCFIDDVEVSQVLCFEPEGFEATNVTAHSVTFDWTQDCSTASSWELYLTTNATDLPEDETTPTLSGIRTHPYTTDPILHMGATYYAYLRNRCSETSVSPWIAASSSFTTLCEPIAMSYTQEFEIPIGTLIEVSGGSLPPCWEGYAANGYAPHNITTWSHSGIQSLGFYYQGESFAVMPEFDDNINQFHISFWKKSTADETGQLQLGYLTDDDNGTCNTFTAIATYEDLNGQWIQCNPSLSDVPETAQRLAFRWYGEDCMCCIDDLEVFSNCSFVGTLSLGEVTLHSANLSWDLLDTSQTEWNVQVSTNADFTEILVDDVAYSHVDYQMNNLDAATYYYVRVRPMCNDNFWSASIGFSTLCEAITITAETPYLQDFESPKGTELLTPGPLSVCWEAYNTGNLDPHIVSTEGTDTQTLCFLDGDNYAILPEFSNPLSGLQISFNMMTGFIDAYRLQLGYLTAEDEGDCGTFTPIVTYENHPVSYVQRTTYLVGVPTMAARLVFRWHSEDDEALCFIDDVEVAIAPILDCYPIGMLSLGEVSNQSAYLNWEVTDTGQTEWDVQVATNEDFTNDVVNYEAASHEDYLLEGLSFETQYYVRVKPSCSDDLWSNTIGFTTLCGPITITANAPYTEGFESAEGTAYNIVYGPLPPCWDAYRIGTGIVPHITFVWGHGSSTQSLTFNNQGVAYALLPEFNNPLNQLQISFWMKTNNNYGQLQLGYLTAEDDGTCNSFTSIVTYNNNNGNMIQQNTVLDNVPAEAKLLAFRWNGSQINLRCYIDDLEVSVNPNAIATQTVALSAGWNWWSTYLDITLDDLKAALVEALPGTTITIKSRNNGYTTYNGSMWRGVLSSLDVTQMYMIQANAACEITLQGMPINPAEHPVTIRPGVNWIAFPLSESMTIANAFAGFPVANDAIKSKSNGYTTFNGTMWRGSLNTLQPGAGYIYQSNATGNRIFTFPTGAK